MPLEKNKVSLIVVGASSFPKSRNFQTDTAFLSAKNRIVDFFCDPHGLSLEKNKILDLFDLDESSDAQDNAIFEFITRMKVQGITDLFLYYVGHGGFTPHEGDFFLAIKCTRDSNPGVSSVRLSTLSRTISTSAHDIRTFIILDCCFSGQAGISFMSNGIIEAVGKKLKEDFPAKGVALLCSSSKDLPSLIIKDRNITMFTEGLDKALRNGDPSIRNKYLSLRQIHNLTSNYIKQLNLGNATRPEVISPIQPMGDIAEIPHFFNNAYAESKTDILVRKREIEAEIIRNNLINASNLFIDFVRDFDLKETYNVESVLIGSDCYDLEEEKSAIEKDIFKERRKQIYVRILGIIKEILLQKP